MKSPFKNENALSPLDLYINPDIMADVAKEAGKRMEYPYTWTAKLLQFPWKFYLTKQWVFKTLPFGILLTAPVFYKISQASYSPENVAKWKEIREKEKIPHIHD